MWRGLVVSLIAALVVVSSAQASYVDSARELNGIVDGWIAKWYPTRVNPCPSDKFRVKITRGLAHPGLAHGWVGTTWVPTRCYAEIRAGMDKCDVCAAWWHEKLHFLLGPDHVGVLAPDGPAFPQACFDRLLKSSVPTHQARHVVNSGVSTQA